jgi:UPF0271 protein
VDLNADLGEGRDPWEATGDPALLGVVTSANVACGFHAGGPSTMRRATEAAAARGVTVGAHVSYRDRDGFGRRRVDVAPDVLADEILYQLGALEAMAVAAGTSVAYVKPHGALYNRIVDDVDQAAAVVAAVVAFRPGTPVLGLPGSVVLRLAGDAGLRPVTEAFPDRGYRPDGTLVARGEEAALHHDPDDVARRAVRLACDGVVRGADGTDVAVAADSLCVHGDAPGAFARAVAVRRALGGAGVTLAPFA